ncbi:MAG TPA: hypothetical protein VF613_25345 [Longimicrobium sp.]
MANRRIGGILFGAANRSARRLATRPFRAWMEALPRQRRFGALLRLARTVAPLAPRRGLGLILHNRSPLESTRDIVFVQLLALLNRYQIPFDPEVTVEGIECLDEAVAAGRGVLLAGPHTHVTILTTIRHLHDSGYPLSAVTLGAFERPAGKKSAIHEIPHNPHFLLAVRDALNEGRTVFAMIDRYTAVPGTVPVETCGGTVHVADALFRLAARCGARVVFVATRTERDRVSCTLGAPPPDGTSEDYMGAFAGFIQAYARRA